MPRGVSAILVLLAALTPPAVGGDQDLERQLTSQYRDKILALRHSYQSRIQEYAADGALLTAGEEGPWTVYGRIVVKKVSVNADRLTLEGKRALYFFDKGKLTELQEDGKHPAESLKVTLRLQQPLSSPDEATAALSRVFALTAEEIVRSAPAYWHALLEKQLGVQDQKEQGSPDAGWEPGSENGVPLLDFKDPHFTPPQILYQKEPEYTDAARSGRLQGVVGVYIVVDRTGVVRNAKVVHPLGLGLDDSAVHTISTWRFTPAKHDGQAVTVAVYIEVDFHLK